MIPVSCDKCKLQYICKIRELFHQPLLDTRNCIQYGLYPDICADFYKLLASYCILYEYDGSDKDEDNKDDEIPVCQEES